jgi:hypothetical protein
VQSSERVLNVTSFPLWFPPVHLHLIIIQVFFYFVTRAAIHILYAPPPPLRKFPLLVLLFFYIHPAGSHNDVANFTALRSYFAISIHNVLSNRTFSLIEIKSPSTYHLRRGSLSETLSENLNTI